MAPGWDATYWREGSWAFAKTQDASRAAADVRAVAVLRKRAMAARKGTQTDRPAGRYLTDRQSLPRELRRSRGSRHRALASGARARLVEEINAAGPVLSPEDDPSNDRYYFTDDDGERVRKGSLEALERLSGLISDEEGEAIPKVIEDANYIDPRDWQ